MPLAIMPYLNCPDLTRAAIADVLAQSVPVTLLLIDNGSGEEGRALGEEYARDPRVLLWRHDPPLPSLSACWNRALRFAWESGCSEAWVINNDVRVWEGTYGYLHEIRVATDALFVTATGVTPAQFTDFLTAPPALTPAALPPFPLPGPDFSCYLISRECHDTYPFDEGYTPAYVEDIDMHRRMMLGGDGARIFGTGLPFEHVGSGTLNGLEREARERKGQQISAGSRAYHQRKWGGGANEERFSRPFDVGAGVAGVTTAELFERVRNGQPAL